MKRFLCGICAILCLGQVCAQNTKGIMPVGIVQRPDGYVIYRPTTSVWVNLTVTENRIAAGPYARYAQKYLGITVPLADKRQWSIAGATIQSHSYEYEVSDPQPSDIKTPVIQPLTASDNGFDKLSADRITSTPKTADEAAREAAQRIFDLRKCRLELVSGDIGENVYGAGLDAALKEITDMENSLLELFVGKQTVTTYTHRYTVDASKPTSIICRFSPQDGLTDESNLAAQPVIIRFTVGEPIENTSAPLAKVKKQATEHYAVAANTTADVLYGDKVIASAPILVFQLGWIIDLPK